MGPTIETKAKVVKIFEALKGLEEAALIRHSLNVPDVHQHNAQVKSHIDTIKITVLTLLRNGTWED